MEHGFGSMWNPAVYDVNIGNSSDTNHKNQVYHFVYVEKYSDGDKYYLYKGQAFNDKDGYTLILMAKHFKEHNEIRIYSVNDFGKNKEGMVKATHRFKSQNNMRVTKVDWIPFDFENSHLAKVCIVHQTNSTKQFTIKSRYCMRCS